MSAEGANRFLFHKFVARCGNHYGVYDEWNIVVFRQYLCDCLDILGTSDHTYFNGIRAQIGENSTQLSLYNRSFDVLNAEHLLRVLCRNSRNNR